MDRKATGEFKINFAEESTHDKSKAYIDSNSQYSAFGKDSALESLAKYLKTDEENKYDIYLVEIAPYFVCGSNVARPVVPLANNPKALNDFFSNGKEILEGLLELAKRDKDDPHSTNLKLISMIWSSTLAVCYLDADDISVITDMSTVDNMSDQARKVFYEYEENVIRFLRNNEEVQKHLDLVQLQRIKIFEEYYNPVRQMPFYEYALLKEEYWDNVREGKQNAQQTFEKKIKLIENQYKVANQSLYLIVDPAELTKFALGK